MGAKLWDRERVIDAIQEYARIYGHPPTAVCWNVGMAKAKGRVDLVERFYEDACWPHTNTVLTYFGSWVHAIAAAGFEPLLPGHHYENDGSIVPNGVGERYGNAHGGRTKTHCKYGHEFTPENTYIVKTGRDVGYRICRECALERNRQAYRRRVAAR
jgi:hypothetical protein